LSLRQTVVKALLDAGLAWACDRWAGRV